MCPKYVYNIKENEKLLRGSYEYIKCGESEKIIFSHS